MDWGLLGMEQDRVLLAPHRGGWAELQRAVIARIRDGCGGLLVAIEPIGSTAVPSLSAKPILDIMPAVAHREDLDRFVPPMTALGFESLGEYGIPGRRYFRLHREGVRVVHVHTFVHGSRGWVRHIAFRDALRGDPVLRREYQALKENLARRHRDDPGAYTDGKTEFIQRVEERALGRSPDRGLSAGCPDG